MASVEGELAVGKRILCTAGRRENRRSLPGWVVDIGYRTPRNVKYYELELIDAEEENQRRYVTYDHETLFQSTAHIYIKVLDED